MENSFMQPDDERIYKVLERLDHEAPRLMADDVIRAARLRPQPWRRAAIILVATTGLAAATFAMPGSPVRAWLSAPAGTEAPAPALSSPEDPAGIIIPADDRVRIEFTGLVTPRAVRFELTGGNEISLRSTSRDVGFTSGEGHVTVEGRDAAASFIVHIPRDAAFVEIRINGRRVLVKNGSQITGSLQPVS
jgi:hypothetical protein